MESICHRPTSSMSSVVPIRNRKSHGHWVTKEESFRLRTAGSLLALQRHYTWSFLFSHSLPTKKGKKRGKIGEQENLDLYFHVVVSHSGPGRWLKLPFFLMDAWQFSETTTISILFGGYHTNLDLNTSVLFWQFFTLSIPKNLVKGMLVTQSCLHFGPHAL